MSRQMIATSPEETLELLEGREDGYRKTIGELNVWADAEKLADDRYAKTVDRVKIALDQAMEDAQEIGDDFKKVVARKVLRQRFASSFARDSACYAFPEVPTDRPIEWALSFTEYSSQSRACRRILLEPKLNLLKRFLDTIAEALVSTVKGTSEDVSDVEQTASRTEEVMAALCILDSQVKPDMTTEDATYYTSAVANSALHSALALIPPAVRDSLLADETQIMFKQHGMVEATLQRRFNLQLPLNETLHSRAPTKRERNIIEHEMAKYRSEMKVMDIESVCAAVGCTNLTPKRKCSRCIITIYCDDACQRAHWKLHKPVCREDFWNVEGVVPPEESMQNWHLPLRAFHLPSSRMLIPTFIILHLLLASTSFAQVVNPAGSWAGATVTGKEGVTARTRVDMAILFVLIGLPTLLIVVVAATTGVREVGRLVRSWRGKDGVHRD
ncbi:hypothetical protein M427DRAFT_55005 [Gonapodya prolifera JEL478]|uniref:MYND-type domain-containing protein n=1 Tax=Gonapodya prolifera (strain JEL478) TaxID=1344416 RepID=A0A139AJL6_GONPJ|nr:hypothetical protein M427DRAFT_55005 [Gonapodya prolifera JEL478]|eukprot:KXS16977.1 hypothetical protein M427DRAFT_55005 [Gonapodya prolifera JEL478]